MISNPVTFTGLPVKLWFFCGKGKESSRTNFNGDDKCQLCKYPDCTKGEKKVSEKQKNSRSLIPLYIMIVLFYIVTSFQGGGDNVLSKSVSKESDFEVNLTQGVNYTLWPRENECDNKQRFLCCFWKHICYGTLRKRLPPLPSGIYCERKWDLPRACQTTGFWNCQFGNQENQINGRTHPRSIFI